MNLNELIRDQFVRRADAFQELGLGMSALVSVQSANRIAGVAAAYRVLCAFLVLRRL